MSKGSDLKRKRPSRAPARKFVIVCEDTLAAPKFFEHISKILPKQLINIDTEGGVGAPMTIAQRCHVLTSSGLTSRNNDGLSELDEVWAVFDRDEHPKYSDAIKLCVSHQIPVAHADPCFEAWLLLAKGEHDGPCNRHQAQDALKEKFPEYDPKQKKTCDFSLFDKETMREMVRRAERRIKNREEESNPHGNPSDTVFCLTQILLLLSETKDGRDTPEITRLRNTALRKKS